MIRREFAKVVAGGAAAFAGVRPWGGLAGQDALRVDGARLEARMGELAQFGKTAAGGISRVAYSQADLDARVYVTGLMREAGLRVTVDVAGNLIGMRPGRVDGLAPLMFGSHIDSVPSGGNYDGQVGSMSAIEVALTLFEADRQLRHPLEVVVFQNEEGGKTGSRALSGEVESFELDIVTASGKTIGEGISVLGGDPARLASARRRRGDVAAFFELHVEQGATLAAGDIPIGVVEGIVGIKRWTTVVRGFANHAGTTPMGDRRDALLGAAQFVQAVNSVAKTIPGRHVATVGRLSVEPGAPNVIPGLVTLSLEIRDLDMAKIDTIFESIRDRAIEIGETTATSFEFEQFYVSRAALTDNRLQQTIADAATTLGLPFVRMPSGAGHDAQSIAQFAPVGMIFVPSRNGISHSPEEYTTPEHIAQGANVLLHTLLAVDAQW